MSSQTASVHSSPRILLVIWLALFGLFFVWSVTGTTALRYLLLVMLLAATPFAGIDNQLLIRCLTRPTLLLLLALTGWIVFHNQFLAWDTSRAWHESTQWFKSMACLGLGVALCCAPRLSAASQRWKRWAAAIALAWALHMVLNVALKDWGSLSLVAALQSGTKIGTRDMVSYLGTGLLAFLLADLVARCAGHEKIFPLPDKWLWTSVPATVVLTAATMTRNSIPVLALELGIAMVALISSSATSQQRSRRSLLAVAVLILISATAIANLRIDQRWQNFADSARLALDIEHNTWWIDQTKNPQPTNAQGVPVGHSTYNRIAWIKGASYLIGEYPLGTGYDRNAFRRALMKHYDAANTASGHAHAGLLDFTLATGLPGGLLFVAALLMSIGYGWSRWQAMRDAASLALVIFVASYLLRATVDGIVRDHMLEQAMFVLGLLLAATVSASAQGKTDMKRILVVRRDNIGDLVCTTPLIRALRQRYPDSRIDALVNSYNLPIVAHNPDLNGAYAYTKAKHRDPDMETFLGVIWRRARLMWQLRSTRYDLVVLANGGCLKRPLRLARLIAPAHTLGFYDKDVAGAGLIDLRVAEPNPRVGHEVETIFGLLAPLGIAAPAGPLVLKPSPAQQEQAQSHLRSQLWFSERATLAVHISARKPSQRWPAASFVAALKALAESHNVQFMLFWSPGTESNPLHPGDDEKASAILSALPAGFALLPWPTGHLDELIGGLATCSGMLCSDGGAMHIGAALGLPIACFFGQSDVNTWRPWDVPHHIMQAPSFDASDIGVAQACECLDQLWPAIERKAQASAFTNHPVD